MSLLSSRLSLIHRCTVERNANGGTDDGWGNLEPPDWEPHIVGLACRGWTAGHDTVTDKGSLAVVAEVHLLVALGTDVTDSDRVSSIVFRGDTIQEGPLAVHAVLTRNDFLELILAKVT